MGPSGAAGEAVSDVGTRVHAGGRFVLPESPEDGLEG